jgi:general secretion pathway protein M
LVGVAAAAVALLVTWSVLVAPAWRVLRDAPAELGRLDAQAAAMQRLAAETRELRATPPLRPAQSAAALQTAAARLGEGSRLVLAGDRATVTLAAVDGTRLREWLAEVRAGARAQVVEAQLTRTPQGYSGSVVLVLPSGGAS